MQAPTRTYDTAGVLWSLSLFLSLSLSVAVEGNWISCSWLEHYHSTVQCEALGRVIVINSKYLVGRLSGIEVTPPCALVL